MLIECIFAKSRILLLAVLTCVSLPGCKMLGFGGEQEQAPEDNSSASSTRQEEPSENQVEGLNRDSLSEIQEKEDEQTDSAKNEKGKADKGILGKITSTVSSGINIITDSVGTIAKKTLDVVGIGSSKDNEEVDISGSIHFSHIGWGDVLQSEEYRYKNKRVSIIQNMQELMDFRSHVSMLPFSPRYKELGDIDFSKENVIVVFAPADKQKLYLNLVSLEFQKSLTVSAELSREADSCDVAVQVRSHPKTFHMVSVPKYKVFTRKNLQVEIKTVSNQTFCERDLGGYSFQNSENELAMKIIHKENYDHGDRSFEKYRYIKVYSNIWGPWEKFKAGRCSTCDQFEQVNGFPEEEIIIQVDFKSNSISKGASEYQYVIENVNKINGFVYLNVYRNKACGRSTVNSFLISLDRKKVTAGGVVISPSKVIVPGPFVPVKGTSCAGKS